MALPAAGNSISLQQVNVELGDTGTDEIAMDDSDVRGLFDVASGAIDMSDGFGKSNEVGINASAASSANLKTLFDNNTAGLWASSTGKRYTIASGTAMGILTLPTGMGGTLTIDNAGTITGTGGTGNGGAGGHAITMNSSVTINNTGTISGGGGAGGNGGAGGAGGQGTYVSNCQNSGASTQSQNGASICTGQDTNLGGNLPVYCGYTNTYYNDEGGGSLIYQGILCGLNATQNGGAGGAGGTSGGVGAGIGQNVSNGGGGASGGGASNNAGAGGAGGAKGNGGALGAAGSNGATGSAGANGNKNNGAAGSSGTAGGAAGKAVNVVAGTLTYNDSGTTNGATN